MALDNAALNVAIQQARAEASTVRSGKITKDTVQAFKAGYEVGGQMLKGMGPRQSKHTRSPVLGPLSDDNHGPDNRPELGGPDGGGPFSDNDLKNNEDLDNTIQHDVNNKEQKEPELTPELAPAPEPEETITPKQETKTENVYKDIVSETVVDKSEHKLTEIGSYFSGAGDAPAKEHKVDNRIECGAGPAAEAQPQGNSNQNPAQNITSINEAFTNSQNTNVNQHVNVNETQNKTEHKNHI